MQCLYFFYNPGETNENDVSEVDSMLLAAEAISCCYYSIFSCLLSGLHVKCGGFDVKVAIVLVTDYLVIVLVAFRSM